MIGKIINKIKDKYLNKHYAVFVDDTGRQREIIKVDNTDDKFQYNKKLYVKNEDRYSNLHIKDSFLFFFTRHNNYFFYMRDYSEPINFTKEKIHKAKNGKPFIAEHLNSIFETKALKSLNTAPMDFLKDLTPKQIGIGIAIIIGIIYVIQNGGVQ